MFTQVAVVPLDDEAGVSLEELAPIIAAIQVQVQRDLGPVWGVQAAVSAFPSLEQVPHGAWPVAVTKPDDLLVDGFHFVMNGLPFGIVGHSDDLSVVLSHEIAEMLVDSFGQLVIAGPPLEDGRQDRVDYHVEVCDICEGEPYQIDGVDVADFVVPGYYNMTHSRPRGYSFGGSVPTPRQVRKGGYITWREPFPENGVFQAFALDGDIPEKLRKLTDRSVPNPGARAATREVGSRRVPEDLRVLKLPNSPTRAWRELIAELAREDERPRRRKRPATTRRPDFADTFRENTDALLRAMRRKQPPPSIAEIIAALEHAGDAEASSGIPGTDTSDKPRRRIIEWLREQERHPDVLGSYLDPELAMWMFMIMP